MGRWEDGKMGGWEDRRMGRSEDGRMGATADSFAGRARCLDRLDPGKAPHTVFERSTESAGSCGDGWPRGVDLFPGVAPHVGVPAAFVDFDEVEVGEDVGGVLRRDVVALDGFGNELVGFVVAPAAF